MSEAERQAQARRERAARTLRENLQRRKQQGRARRAGDADEAVGLPAAGETDRPSDATVPEREALKFAVGAFGIAGGNPPGRASQGSDAFPPSTRESVRVGDTRRASDAAADRDREADPHPAVKPDEFGR